MGNDDPEPKEVDDQIYEPLLPNLGYMSSLFSLDTKSRGRLWSNNAIVFMFNPPWAFDVIPTPDMGIEPNDFLEDILTGLRTATQIYMIKASPSFVYMSTGDEGDTREAMCNRSFVDVFYFKYGKSLRFFIGNKIKNTSKFFEDVIYVVSKTTLVGLFMPIVGGSHHGEKTIQES